jgi:CHAT domain-containing protein
MGYRTAGSSDSKIVPDLQTQELMIDFYHRILEGKPCVEALCQAQLAMKAKYPQSLLLRSFELSGEPHAIPPMTTHREPTHA